MIKYSVETLHHFHCGECAKWWTIADFEHAGTSGGTCPHCGHSSELSRDPDAPEDPISVERKRCADFAEKWLRDWAAELAETRDEYVESASTGKIRLNKRTAPISRTQAETWATHFCERADAVKGCADTLPRDIRERPS